MPKTVKIRDIDDEVYARLKRLAAAEGVSVPELLKRLAVRVASRQTMTEWLQRVRGTPVHESTTDVNAVLDELRGPWPDSAR